VPDRSKSPAKLPLLYAATFANFCAFGMYFTAIQLFVEDELGGSKSQVGLAIGAFSLTAVLVRPSIGRGVDVRGRRPYLLGALALLTVSSLGFFAAHNITTVVVLRLAQGIAGATYYTTAASMATDLAPLRRRATAIATFSLFLYGGFATGPAIAGVLIDAGGFGWAWGTTAALGAAGLVCARFLPETRGLAGDPEEAPRVTRRGLHPAAIGPGVVLMTTGMGYASVTGFSELYARHIGMGSAGALYATFAVTVIGVRLVSGRLADTHGRIAVALPGLLVAAAGLALLSTVQVPAAAFPGVAAFGAGFALIFPALMAFTVDRVGDHERGEALGSFTAFMDVGIGGGGYLVGFVADQAGFAAAYGTPAVLCLLGAGLLTSIARREGVPLRRDREADPAGIELS
jgi:MFS family permease